MNGGPIAIFRFPISLQYCPAPNRSLRGTRKVMLATAKNSLGVYASLSPSRRRCRAELARSWLLSPRIHLRFPLISFFGCPHLLWGPEFLLPPVTSTTEMRVTIFRIANYSVCEARFFSFVNPSSILKPHPDRIHCCNYNQIAQMSGQPSHMNRKFM